MAIIIGTAGWSIARRYAEDMPSEGSALQRYAGRLNGVEINSSFYRSHRPETWARWSASVPADFRFAVKVPKAITHQHKLTDCGALVATFLGEVSGLGDKLAVLLVQLPPSLAFDAERDGAFFDMLGTATAARVACEPRHPSWFEGDAEHLMERMKVARVAADPARVPAAGEPGGWRGFGYWRLHGSPVMYRSAYDAPRIAAYAAALRRQVAAGGDAWCMFDNTASSAALGDALALVGRAGEAGPPGSTHQGGG